MVKILFCLILSLTKDTVLTDYISFIHLNYLSKICVESGFKGLAYCGGPEVICQKWNKPTILPCVEYCTKKDYSREVNAKPPCLLCEMTDHIELQQVNLMF